MKSELNDSKSIFTEALDYADLQKRAEYLKKYVLDVTIPKADPLTMWTDLSKNMFPE